MIAPMNTRPIAARAVTSLAALARRVIVVDGRRTPASRLTLTPPYRAALGPTAIVLAPSAARMARCKPALAAAIPATSGRLTAVNRAMAAGLLRAQRSAAVSQAHHRAASVISAAVSTMASGRLQGRAAAALMSL